MTEVIEPPIETVTIDVVLSALADPVRLTFVRALSAVGDWTCGSDVLKETGVTIGKSTLSHHIKVLRDAGLIRTRVDGIRRLVTIRYDDVEQRFPGLLTMIGKPNPARATGKAPASTARPRPARHPGSGGSAGQQHRDGDEAEDDDRGPQDR